MQKLKVSKVESKPTSKGGTMVALYDDKGTRFSGFLKELQDIHEGDTVEVEIQVDGKYNNITSVKNVVKATPEQKAEAVASSNETQTVERASIEAQVAFKGVIDLIINGMEVDASLKTAAMNWAGCKLKNWFPTKPAAPPAPAPKAEPTTSSATTSKAPPVTQTASKELTYEVLDADAKKVGWANIWTWVINHFQVRGKTPKEVFEALNTEQRAELKKELDGRIMADSIFGKET